MKFHKLSGKRGATRVHQSPPQLGSSTVNFDLVSQRLLDEQKQTNGGGGAQHSSQVQCTTYTT